MEGSFKSEFTKIRNWHASLLSLAKWLQASTPPSTSWRLLFIVCLFFILSYADPDSFHLIPTCVQCRLLFHSSSDYQTDTSGTSTTNLELPTVIHLSHFLKKMMTLKWKEHLRVH